MTDPWYKLTDLSLETDKERVLNRVNLELYRGEIHALTGRPGSGKSSLARIMTGQQTQTSGTIEIEEKPLPPLASSTAISRGLILVKGSPDLFEDLSVVENIFFFTYTKKRFLSFTASKTAKECSGLLQGIGLDISPKTLVRDLKPSDRMIVALLQALQQKPNLIILDEALQVLSPRHLEAIQDRLKAYTKEDGTILWITQKIDSIHPLANRVSVLADGQIILTDQANQIDRLSLVKLSYAGLDESGRESGRQFYQILKYNEAILQQLPMSLVVIDENKRIQMVNDTGQKFLSCTIATLRQKPVEILLKDPVILQLVNDCFAQRHEVTAYQATVMISDQGKIININVLPILEGDSILGAIIILEDISQSEQMRRQIILSEKLASIGLLASGVAHEINNPLEIMASSLRHLRRRLDDANLTDVVDELDEEINHIRDIISNLVTFSSDQDSNYETFDLKELLESILKLIKFNAREKGINVILSGEPENPCVTGKRGEIKQVVLNLLKNSFEAMPSGGTVLVNLKNRHTTLVLTVTDSGTGITSRNPDEIFLPFYSTKKGKASNMGLGLSIIYGIIQRHNGTIASRNLDSGCEFTITLPSGEN